VSHDCIGTKAPGEDTMSKKQGRKRGSRNKGYFYRTGRGWFTKIGSQFFPLLDANGERLRDKETPADELQIALGRFKASQKHEEKQQAARKAARLNVTILDVCMAYLKQVEATGAKKTLDDRSDTLFDFCFGLPPAFRSRDGKPSKAATPADKLHVGYGALPVAQLRPIDVDQWLQSHPTWNGGRRSRIQAVKRALNYGVESGLIERNPIRGYKTPRPVGRVTYITPEQEAALLENARYHFRMALKVCLRTGARPGCEFAKLTAKHVKDHGDRMEWVFGADESKTKKLRIIRITDPEIMEIVRKQITEYPTGPIFRTLKGDGWTRSNLSQKFRALKAKIAKKGIKLDDGACIYSLRHSYAKRILQGFWSGKQTNIETLARLMGNSPQVCAAHYLLDTGTYQEPLWEAC